MTCDCLAPNHLPAPLSSRGVLQATRSHSFASRWRRNFLSSASTSPPWPKGSSSSLHLSVAADGTMLVSASTHRPGAPSSILKGYWLCRSSHTEKCQGFKAARFSSAASFSCGLVFAGVRTHAQAGHLTRQEHVLPSIAWTAVAWLSLPPCSPSRPRKRRSSCRKRK